MNGEILTAVDECIETTESRPVVCLRLLGIAFGICCYVSCAIYYFIIPGNPVVSLGQARFTADSLLEISFTILALPFFGFAYLYGIRHHEENTNFHVPESAIDLLVVAALVWGYIYGPAFGPFSQLAKGLGLPPPDFLSDRTMLFSLANIVTWEFTGYNMIIYYAALKAIPLDLREAAVMDGAGAWQYALFVQLPMLWPAILLTIIFSINGTLQLFNEPYLMRSIAPAVINTHYTPNIYAYYLSAANQQYNYAAAVSFVLGLIIAVIAGAFTLATRRGEEASR